MLLQLGALEGVAALGLVFGLAALGILFVLGIVYMEHRKEMALIEAGAHEEVTEDGRAWILGGGLLLVAIGLGTVVEALLAGEAVDGGVTALFVGLAALVYYAVKRRQSAADDAAGDPGRSG